MKKIIAFITAILLYITAFAQDNMSAQAIRYRNEIKKFLIEEGFSPTVDGNKIDFKKEGTSFWINFEGETPVFVSLRITGYTNDYSDETAMLTAVSQANLIKSSAKAFLFDDKSVGFAVQFYSVNPEEFKNSFYKNMSDIEMSKENVKSYYNELYDDSYEVKEPFKIQSVNIGNVTKSGDVISDYGKNIYSNSTQYLKPKLYIDTYTEGDYDIYIKVYAPDGISTGSSSPSGYSYKYTLSLKKNTSYYFTTGWGTSESGNWKAGEYRFEFYYKDKLLFTKKFNVI